MVMRVGGMAGIVENLAVVGNTSFISQSLLLHFANISDKNL